MQQHHSWLFRGRRFSKPQLPRERDWRTLLARQKVSG
jgi:hypothetical protein